MILDGEEAIRKEYRNGRRFCRYRVRALHGHRPRAAGQVRGAIRGEVGRRTLLSTEVARMAGDYAEFLARKSQISQ